MSLTHLINKYGLRIKGIIHVGAHYAEEHKEYLKNNINKVAYIEASPKVYHKLCRLNLQGEVSLHNVALADYEGSAELYVETANQGQSSSLLEPGTHTTHYPNIVFDQREPVQVTTLDSLKLVGYNMLNIDVQGAELLVLKGGTKTLDNIDVIYIEVNREEVYKGCPMVEELDRYLDGAFKRVETMWTDQGWGDALYIRTATRNMFDVPFQFRPAHPQQYPSTNKIEFERWFYETLRPGENKSERVYLPIAWTAYYVKNKYAQYKPGMQALQIFLNRLPRQHKYFTIVQYDDGILHDLSHLDVKIFSMSGGRVDYPLPLIAWPLPVYPATGERDILCSFVGILSHPIRKRIYDQLHGKDGFYISTARHKTKEYCDILSRSKFVLCPRGYGRTSFRIQEAMQYGATPIYISDEFILPHHDFSYGYLIQETEPGKFPGKFMNSNGDPINLYDFIMTIKLSPKPQGNYYRDYFTYEANKQLILKNL